jgi:serine/threonine-protein kinase
MMPELIGKTISHYTILEKIGEGGMGVVYRAEDTRLKRTVALKFLSPWTLASRQDRTRLIREAQAAAALDHPSICTVHEIDEDAGLTFISMAHIEGDTLRDTIRAGALGLQDALDIARQLAAGLEEAHAKGVIHRDIKPGNIMITPRRRVKIMDFGLAKLAGAQRVTRNGTTLGTAAYMSPEQAQGKPVDPRTDIWSLGVVLYEMITGRLPFRRDNEQAVLYAICHEMPTPIADARSDVPQPLAAIVKRCLERDPSKRYGSCTDLLADLRRLQRAMDSATIPLAVVRRSRLRALARPVRWLILPAALLAAVVIVAVVYPPIRWPVIRRSSGEAIPEQRHLAVLPFLNVGADARNQPFCDGLVEILTSKLTQLEELQGSLWVVPASEVRGRGITTSREARREFGVTLAITGSIQRDLDQVLLTLNLVNAKTLRQLRSSVIEEELANVSALQDGIVAAVSEMLEIELKPEKARLLAAGRTDVARAYDLYLQGRGHLQRYEDMENIDRAIALFAGAVAEDAGHALAFAGLGEAYWRKYDLSKDVRWVAEATRYCGHALELTDELAAVFVTLGLIHAGTGHADDAVTDFERALALEPLNPDAHLGLAGAYESQGKLAEAEVTYERALELRPGCWAGHNNLGRFYFKHGRYEEAETQFLQVIALTPDNTRGYSSLGGIYVYLNRREEARQMFARSLEIKPNYFAYANLGTLYFQEERYDEAARMYEQALELEDHRDHRIWGNLAASYDCLGEHEKAQENCRRAAEIAEEQRQVNPLAPGLLCILAGYYQMLGEGPRAETLVEQALNLAPDDVEVLFLAARTYETLGRREKALQWIGKALDQGYPLDKIERARALEELRADPRFQRLREREGAGP